MPRLPLSVTGETPMQKILGHNPLIYRKWQGLAKAVFSHRSLGPELLEQVRRVIAYAQRCHY